MPSSNGSNGVHHQSKIALLTECQGKCYSEGNLENFKRLLSDKYNLYVIMIQKDRWTYAGEDGDKIDVDKNDFSIDLNGRKVKFDAVMNTVDDTGNNAFIQSYLELLNIPTPNPGMLSTAIAFNKYYTNILVSSLGIKIPVCMQIRNNLPYNLKEISEQFTFPIIVKPIFGTNSYGVIKVDEIETLEEAIKNTCQICPKILIEEFIKGRELTCAAYKSLDSIKIIGITERISEIADFFDYQTKLQDKYQQITPADIPSYISQKIASIVQVIYTEFEYQGIIRCDFILEEGTGELYFLEVNSFPVLSSKSVVGLQAEAAGSSLKEILCEIIDNCIEKSKNGDG